MECDPGTLYDGVALCTVIENDRGTPSQDGDLTAAIRYRNPYTILKGNYVVLSFGICDNVAVNAIIGLPALNAFEAMVYLQHNKLNCKVITQIVHFILMNDLVNFQIVNHTIVHLSIQYFHPAQVNRSVTISALLLFYTELNE